MNKSESLKYVWTILILAPILLFVLTMIMGMWFSMQQPADYVNIGMSIINNIPYILLVNHTLLFFGLWLILNRERWTFTRIGWSFPGRLILAELLIGAVIGAACVFLSHYGISPLINKVGLGGSAFHPGEDFPYGTFTAIAVIVAPIVEESIYRGYALQKLRPRFGAVGALFISSIFFALLHYGEGLVGIIVALFVGLVFCAVYFWRKNLLPLLMAHGLFNLITIQVFR